MPWLCQLIYIFCKHPLTDRSSFTNKFKYFIASKDHILLDKYKFNTDAESLTFLQKILLEIWERRIVFRSKSFLFFGATGIAPRFHVWGNVIFFVFRNKIFLCLFNIIYCFTFCLVHLLFKTIISVANVLIFKNYINSAYPSSKRKLTTDSSIEITLTERTEI